jgi:hypothetical protein
MDNQSEWRAKIAFACYLALIGGILLGSLISGLILLGMIGDYRDLSELSFPIALISLPINETIILGVTLLFARYKGASLKGLGLKKTSFRVLTIVSVVAVPLFLLGVSISVGEEMIFGPDPMAKDVEMAVIPRDALQLVTMIIFALVLVGPCEELAFRGFVQRGFENSFGKTNGLLIASVLFGVMHGLNTLYAIVPVIAVSLVLGYVWQRTGGNTIASALLHGVYDSIAIATAYFLTV